MLRERIAREKSSGKAEEKLWEMREGEQRLIRTFTLALAMRKQEKSLGYLRGNMSEQELCFVQKKFIIKISKWNNQMRSEVNGYIPCFAIALPFSCCHFVFTALPFFRRRTCMAHHKTSQKVGVGREAGRESLGKQSNEIWRSLRKTFFNSIYWEFLEGKLCWKNFSVKYFFRFCFSFICTYGKSFFRFHSAAHLNGVS